DRRVRTGDGREVGGGDGAVVDRGSFGEAACHRVEGCRDDSDVERLVGRARAVGGRRPEVEVDAGGRASRIGEAVEYRARRGRVARGERLDVARRERVGEELLRAGRAGREEEEGRADRAALADGAGGVERVRGARRRDRRALRVLEVGERRRGDPVGRVVLEARRGLSTLEVADEGEEASADVLLPRDV